MHHHSADMPTFPKIVQDFFCIYLLNEKDVSRQTVVSYRDTFRLLLLLIRKHRCGELSDLTLLDLDVDLILGFLKYLERESGNTILAPIGMLTQTASQ